MEQQALGLVEVIGLTAAVEAADVACKAANVTLVGYELTRGKGMVTIKVLGQVGAVNAAVTAAAVAAAKINRVVSTLVIARPDAQIEPLVRSAAVVAPVTPADRPAKSPAGEAPATPRRPVSRRAKQVDAAKGAAGRDVPPPTPTMPASVEDGQSNNKEEK